LIPVGSIAATADIAVLGDWSRALMRPQAAQRARA
jgi:hypothetical protein